MAAWDALCATCGALGPAANMDSWHFAQDGSWWHRCCLQCARNCRASFGDEHRLTEPVQLAM
eukprot:2417039-Pyramimonas_sp.AAC.1